MTVVCEPLGEEAISPNTSSLCIKGATYESVKRGLDVIVALVLLVLSAPITLAALIFTKLTSRGPALYSQTRLGLRGQSFTIYKIRTMAHNCEKQSGARWCVPGDQRITSLGRVLRASKVDELPQLWNVLQGEMSLIGPRPERPEFVPHLEASIPRYRERLSVLPGLSGLAQVQLPADSDLDSVRRKLGCDLCYIRNMSLWLDLRIAAATVLYILRLPATLTRVLLCLPGAEPVEPVSFIDEATFTPAAGISAV